MISMEGLLIRFLYSSYDFSVCLLFVSISIGHLIAEQMKRQFV